MALERLPLACPIDGTALAADGARLRCADGHAYDVARHGYANLLPVQFKPSRDPGDDAAMVAARRRVLESGLYAPLADAVAAEVRACLGTRAADARPALLVDAGCGEGTHTARVARALRAAPGLGGVGVLGTDISVHAVRAAARRHRDVGWAVANNTRLPVRAGAADVVTSLFGFATWAPWAALQAPGAHVVVAHPGARHLLELRAAIYADVREREPPPDRAAPAAGYALVAETRVAFVAPGVPAGLLGDVLAMTPHAHRAARDVSDPAAALAGLDGTPLGVDVVLRRYRRDASADGGGGRSAAPPLAQTRSPHR